MSEEMLQIEKGVPIPSQHDYRWQPSRYPFMALQIGDSFFVKCELPDVQRVAWAVIKAAKVAERKNGAKYSYRKSICGVRVWRVA